MLVADGVGGAPAGHLASGLAVKSMVAGLGEMTEPDANSVQEQVVRANAMLAQTGRDYPSVRGMATTMTGLVMAGDVGYLVHVGDSRAFRLRDGVFEQMTVDQSWVQMLMDEGMLDPAEVSTHPMRNMLMHSLSGALRDPEYARVTPVDLRAGDRWLIATDGLTGYLPAEVIAEQLAEKYDPSKAADVLVDLCWPHSLDNITVVVGDVVETDVASEGWFVGAVAETTRPVRRSQAG